MLELVYTGYRRFESLCSTVVKLSVALGNTTGRVWCDLRIRLNNSFSWSDQMNVMYIVVSVYGVYCIFADSEQGIIMCKQKTRKLIHFYVHPKIIRQIQYPAMKLKSFDRFNTVQWSWSWSCIIRTIHPWQNSNPFVCNPSEASSVHSQPPKELE